jgi:hypothetical protein
VAVGDEFPDWLWHASLALLCAVIISSVILAALVLGGVGDPRPIGELAVYDELDNMTGWLVWPGEATATTGKSAFHLVIPEAEMSAFVIAPYEFHAPGSLELVAWQEDGPSDAGYGLWWGQGPDSTCVVVAINGNGYFTIFEVIDGQTIKPVEEWQRFPHIRPQGEANRLQVDLYDDQAVLRINDELASTFDRTDAGTVRIGFYGETLGTGGSLVAFDRLRIWQN